jgi:hypothetical protein
VLDILLEASESLRASTPKLKLEHIVSKTAYYFRDLVPLVKNVIGPVVNCTEEHALRGLIDNPK